jgi:membrane protease YdiL (CAAX protease family)
MAEALHMLGPGAPDVLRLLMLVVVLLAAWSIRRRQVPWARVALVAALEGTFYGLLLGPLASVMAESTRLMLAPAGRLVADLVGSLGAGLFEEAVFRLFLLSLLGLLFMRLCQTFVCPRVVGVVAAVVVSAALFSWFHHVGPGAQPFAPGVFVFRAMAGLLLGTLFVLRGFGVCVYTHVMYDVHYYLTHR